jgi:hypothetical protein
MFNKRKPVLDIEKAEISPNKNTKDKVRPEE